MIRTTALLATATILMTPAPGPAQDGSTRGGDFPRVALEIETGPVWQTRNEVQIPNDESGTRFSLRELTGSGAWPAGRLYLTWRPARRHEIRALLAPLSFTEKGQLSKNVDFAGSEYRPDTPIEATYRFNSYRLTYRYRLWEGEDWTWRIGFTAKLRDALVELKQGPTTSRKPDIGFVPLLHVAGRWRFEPRWSVELEADALAGGPGRAEDVSLKVAHELDEDWSVSAGYRTVEGGANVDQVYAFAWLHYGVASLEYRF